MNLYRPNDSARRARRRLLYVTFFVVAIFAVDILTGGALRHGTRALGSRVWQLGSGAVDAVGHSGYLSSRASLEAKVQSLSDQVAQLQAQVAGDAVLKSQNEELRSLVHLAALSQGVTAPIVSSVGSSPYGTFLIGGGTSDGLAKDDLVIAPGGFVIGTISDVSAGRSVVTELFAPDSKVDVIIGSARVSVAGRGGGNAYARLPHGLEARAGDPIMAPLFGGRPVGIIGSVASSSASAYSDVYIGLPVSLESMRYVYIIHP